MINLGIRVFDRLRHFLDICSTWTLHNFCSWVELGLFEKGCKVWSTSHVPIHLMKQFKKGYNLSFYVTFWFQTSWNFSNCQDGLMIRWCSWKRHVEHKPTFEKGQHVRKGVLSKFKLGLISIHLTSTLPSPLPKLWTRDHDHCLIYPT